MVIQHLMIRLDVNIRLLIIRNVCFLLVNIVTPPNLLFTALLSVRFGVLLIVVLIDLFSMIHLLLLVYSCRIIPALHLLSDSKLQKLHLFVCVFLLVLFDLHSVLLASL